MEELLLNDLLEKYDTCVYPIEVNINEMLIEEINKCSKKIIVLDDDPTGVQTVHDIYVYTDWSEESIRSGLLGSGKMFFILTNSRGLTQRQTIGLHRTLTENILKVSKETGVDFLIISRGDSTLRGHYPLETKVIKEVLESKQYNSIDGEILFPFFKEGGRYTASDIHYVADGMSLIPAGETEFAGDKTFGYKSSNLCEYIEEKTGGEFKKESVTSITLESLVSMDIEGIKNQLLVVKSFNKVIVNALDYKDVEVFCIALYKAMNSGKNFLFRSAAAFVKVMGGVTFRPYLTREEMISTNQNGGIIVAGSHTAKTTEQLKELEKIEKVFFIEFNSDLVLENRLEEEVNRVLNICSKYIAKGQTVVIHTKRKLLVLKDDTPDKALLRSVKISAAVQDLVGKLEVCPAFVIAKGGITSSDIGVKALKVKKALVLGQAKPGIPVWKTGSESKFPGIPYIIFPGNVGDKTTLKEIVEILIP